MPLQYNFQQQDQIWAKRVEPKHQGEGERQFTRWSKRYLHRRPQLKAKARGLIQLTLTITFVNKGKTQWEIWENGKRITGCSSKVWIVQIIYTGGRVENSVRRKWGRGWDLSSLKWYVDWRREVRFKLRLRHLSRIEPESWVGKKTQFLEWFLWVKSFQFFGIQTR